MDFSKLFFSVAPTNEPYYAIEKGFYDAIFENEPDVAASYAIGVVQKDGSEYVIVSSNVDDEFWTYFGPYEGECKYYYGGFSNIQDYQS